MLASTLCRAHPSSVRDKTLSKYMPHTFKCRIAFTAQHPSALGGSCSKVPLKACTVCILMFRNSNCSSPEPKHCLPFKWWRRMTYSNSSLYLLMSRDMMGQPWTGSPDDLLTMHAPPKPMQPNLLSGVPVGVHWGSASGFCQTVRHTPWGILNRGSGIPRLCVGPWVQGILQLVGTLLINLNVRHPLPSCSLNL